MNRVLEAIQVVEETYASKFGQSSTQLLSQRVMLDLERYKPFIQALASPMTAEMRTMVVAVLEGGSVTRVSFDYARKSHARIEIEVEDANQKTVAFSSTELWDVEALRHFGLMKVGNAPVIDGYYAFNKVAPPST